MPKATIDLSVEALKKHFGITDRQAKVLYRWIVARQTRLMTKNEQSADEMTQAQHALKSDDVFPKHDQRMKITREAEKIFL